MDRLTTTIDKNIKSVMVAIAVAGLIWGMVSLFFPVRTTFISGFLDSGRPYAETFTIYAYNALGGLLVVLTGLTNSVSSVQLLRGNYSALKGLGFACFSAVLLISIIFVGATPVISWFPGIPPEIQHGISTPYVNVIESVVRNIVLQGSLLLAVVYVLLGIGYLGYMSWLEKSSG